MKTNKTRKPSDTPAEAQREVPPMGKVIDDHAATGEEIRYKLFDIQNLLGGIRLVATTMPDDFDIENDVKHVFQTAACVAVEKVDEVLRDLEINGAFEDDEAA